MRSNSFGRMMTCDFRAVWLGCLAAICVPAAARGQVHVITEQQKLLASDGDPSDKFGFAVDREGDLLIIGAPQHYTNALPGSIYIFARGSDDLWTQQQRIFSNYRPGEAEFGDTFGTDLALEGNTLVVGAPFAEHEGTMLVGLVYVFSLDASGEWILQQTLLPDGGGLVRFGEHLEVSGDTAVIASAHRVFIYQHDIAGGGWVLADELEGIPFAVIGSIAFDGQSIVVGSGDIESELTDPQGLVYTKIAGQWQLTSPLYTSVDGLMTAIRDIGIDGDQLALGMLDIADQDRAFVFSHTVSDGWAEQAMLDPNSVDDSFGADVVIRDHRLLVGAPHGGLTYLYTRTAEDTWIEQLHLQPSDALSKNFGDEIHFQDGIPVIGSWAHHENGLYSGAVYVFDELPSFLPGDVTGNGVVDVDDVLAVINSWGPCPAPPTSCDADIAPDGGNGNVDVDDLLKVINSWS